MSTLADRLFLMLLVGALAATGLMAANPMFAFAAVICVSIALPIALKLGGHPIYKVEVIAVLTLSIGLGRVGAALVAHAFGAELYVSASEGWYVGPCLAIGGILCCVSHGMADCHPRPVAVTAQD